MTIRSEKKRVLTLLLAAFFVLFFFLSTAFMTEEAHHDCVGDGCPICMQISALQNFFKQLDTGAALTAAVLVLHLIFRCITPKWDSFFLVTSPVRLKVRMNN
ncbi:MAG: hypothetical protein EUB_01368 [Eubacterium sp.]|uniref:hypothetical protein n=1 Tax=Eubacterium TaxID=1730 RepID=UPI000735DA93|nr:hypothetical protein [Eubacterium maltosivorans]ALU16204.1 hypothetical protein ACH52_3468 [Eubacterium limosum]WPK81767.1 hypothetical protein EUMA32_32240 [Eubacterium maltosivorans]SDP27110.1 hypothetical protein SAMN04515624_10847 [Eubacterium maltosivorans]